MVIHEGFHEARDTLSHFYCVAFFAEKKKEYAIKKHGKQGGFNLKCLVPLLPFESALDFCQTFFCLCFVDGAYNVHIFSRCQLLYWRCSENALKSLDLAIVFYQGMLSL